MKTKTGIFISQDEGDKLTGEFYVFSKNGECIACLELSGGTQRRINTEEKKELSNILLSIGGKNE